MIEIEQALTAEDHAAAARLMDEFLAVQRERYKGISSLVDGYFDQAEWDRELADLQKKYAPPDGFVLIAYLDNAPRGVVALQKLQDDICEMKRLFVQEEAQGAGLGKMLCRTLITRARELGYTKMRLDTGFLQLEAQGLYRKLGFREIEQYQDYPADIGHDMVYMELDL